MDYRFGDQQRQLPSVSHDDQQLAQHQQHLQQHLPHYSHQHGLQTTALPHQMQHIGQSVFLATNHNREAFNRRHSGQDMQSFMEAAVAGLGLVPIRSTSQPLTSPHASHQAQDTPGQLQDGHLQNMDSPRQFTTMSLSATIQEQQPQYPTDLSHQIQPRTLQPQQQQQKPPLQQKVRQQKQQKPKQDKITKLFGQKHISPSRRDDSPSHAESEASDSDGDAAAESEPPPPPLRIVDRDGPGPVPSAPIAPRLPSGLVYVFADSDMKRIVGVKAEKRFGKGVDLGIFEGSLVDEATGCVEESSWELCLQGKVICYVDGKYKRNKNWKIHVPCARNPEEQNVEAFQQYGYLRFRTSSEVEAGNELRVFYGAELIKQVGFKTGLEELEYIKDEDSFRCKHCRCLYRSAKGMLRHIKLAHEQENTGDEQPIFCWEEKEQSPEPVKKPVVQIFKVDKESDKCFICVTCGKDFPTKGRLAAHEAFHQFTGGSFTCETCSKTFDSALDLTKHILVKHEEKKFKCEACQKFYTSYESLKRHQRDFHDLTFQIVACSVCKEEFSDEEAYVRHKSSHENGNEKIKKEKKKYEPKGRIKMARHTQKVMSEGSAEGSSNDQADQKDKKENALDRKLPVPTDMLGRRLALRSDQPYPYKCRHCGLKYRQIHMRNYHEKEVHEGGGKFVCPWCSQKFVTRSNLNMHMKRHDRFKPFHCKLCPRTFASQKALDNHQGEHNGLKPFKCPVCNHGFRTKKLMGKHRTRMHTKREMRHKCSFCDKMFMEKSGLQNHERRHRGIRPYVCLVCGKAFSSKDSMAKHQRVHTGEMPFKCDVCGKQFRNTHNLTDHLVQHSKEASELDIK